MTRLRFILKDESKADDEKVKKHQWVMGLVKQVGNTKLLLGTISRQLNAAILKMGVAGGAVTNESGKPKES